ACPPRHPLRSQDVPLARSHPVRV
ncbi:hypothetical protein BN1708_018757, partial [Verticillium longisporum]